MQTGDRWLPQPGVGWGNPHTSFSGLDVRGVQAFGSEATPTPGTCDRGRGCSAEPRERRGSRWFCLISFPMGKRKNRAGRFTTAGAASSGDRGDPGWAERLREPRPPLTTHVGHPTRGRPQGGRGSGRGPGPPEWGRRGRPRRSWGSPWVGGRARRGQTDNFYPNHSFRSSTKDVRSLKRWLLTTGPPDGDDFTTRIMRQFLPRQFYFPRYFSVLFTCL